MPKSPDLSSSGPQDARSQDTLAEENRRLRAQLSALQATREELEHANRQLSMILEQQPIILYVCRATGDRGATFMSPSIQRITGYDPADALAQPSFWADRIHPDDRDRVLTNFEQLFVRGSHEHEYRWRVADGSYRVFHDCIQIIHDEEGNPEYMAGAWFDVTEHELAAQRLVDQRMFLRALIDSIPDLVSVYDSEGRVTLCNHAFAKTAGREIETIIGEPIEQLFPGQQGHDKREAVGRVVSLQEAQSMAMWICEPAGSERIIENVMVPYGEGSAGSTSVIAIGRDVTERQRINQELQDAKDKAEFASQSKTEFLANMSHEIRTPLNSILGYSQLLSRRAKEQTFPDYVSEYLSHINLSGYNLSEIINNILELSKIEEGKVTTSPEALDLGLLIQRLYKLSKLHTNEKGIDFSLSYDPNLPKAIRTDRTKLTQILNNLLSNAIKFTESGKRIVLGVEASEGMIRFSVADEGIGIAESKQDAIFKAFEQADGSITRLYGGTGLGLAICRRLGRLLGGDILVESTLGVGATFTLLIPLVDCTEDFERVEPVDTTARFAPDSRVLVVEDNPINQAVIRAMFNEIGLEVTLAEDGEVGVRRAIELEPECIFMDLHMPRLDGLQATRQLRQLPQFADTPIIALSADAFSEQKEVAFNAGVTAYLTKPVILDKLVSKLVKYLRPAERKGRSLKRIVNVAGLEEYSPQLFTQLREMFVTMVPDELATFGRHVAKQEHKLAVDQAHNLKNYGVGMLATRFTEVARDLESECKRENWAQVAELIPRLEGAYVETKQALFEWERQGGKDS